MNCWTHRCAKSPVRLNKHQASGHQGGGSHVKQTHTHISRYYQKALYAVGAKCAHYIPTCYLTVVVSMLSPGSGPRCVCLCVLRTFSLDRASRFSALVNGVVQKFISAGISDLFPLKTSLESSSRKSLERRHSHRAVLYGNRGCRLETWTYTSYTNRAQAFPETPHVHKITIIIPRLHFCTNNVCSVYNKEASFGILKLGQIKCGHVIRVGHGKLGF